MGRSGFHAMGYFIAFIDPSNTCPQIDLLRATDSGSGIIPTNKVLSLD
jgi:hypothetical protein